MTPSVDDLQDLHWLREQLSDLVTSVRARRPSQVAEEVRYLPQATSDSPGPFSWDLSPYFREPLDLLGPDSPYTKVVIEKGVQMGYTVAVLENFILYQIVEVKTRPVLFATISDDMCETRVNTNIAPMIQHSDLMHLIQSHDQLSQRKAGKTDKRLSWAGGGWMTWLGAIDPGGMHSLPFPTIVMDEVDRWRATKDGHPVDLFAARGKTFSRSGVLRMLLGSTPSLAGQSRIHDEYLTGDQRHLFVRCLSCGGPQRLRWRRVDKESGVVSGIEWDTNEGVLDPKSLRYLCKFCNHPHTEDDKYKLISLDNIYWEATEKKPLDPRCASFHAPALMSLMQPWSDWATDWIKAIGNGTEHYPEHPDQMRVFYNNCLAMPYADHGRSVKLSDVSLLRRPYAYGQIPSKLALKTTGHPILFLTCSVDVHDKWLSVAVFGWAPWGRAFLIRYEEYPPVGPDGVRPEGNTGVKNDPLTWGCLDTLLQTAEWVDDLGHDYKMLDIVGVDSGDGERTDQVYEYCAEYAPNPVFPIKGEPMRDKAKRVWEFKQPMTASAWHITVDFFKDRWSHGLKQIWSGEGTMPHNFLSVPINTTDPQLAELTKERKIRKVNTKGEIVHEWYRPKGSTNELWDHLVYNSALLEIACLAVSIHQFDPKGKTKPEDWPQFWAYLEAQRGR